MTTWSIRNPGGRIRTRRKRLAIPVAIALAVMSASAADAHEHVLAYLDPGTGNVLINIVIATIAALLYSLTSLYYYLFKKQAKAEGGARGDGGIALFTEGKMYWTTFRPLVEALLAQKRRFSYYALDIEDPGLLIESQYMDCRFLGYGWASQLNFYRIRAKALVSTTPNIGTPEYPLKRPPSVGKLIHIWHSVNDMSAYRAGSLDCYDTVFMVGDFQEKSIRELEALRGLPQKELVPLGLPYLDVFVDDKQEVTTGAATKTVLIGSSWGTKGCLASYGSGFIKAIAKEGYDVIIRPHPHSYKVEKELLDRLEGELKEYPNITWDSAVSPVQSMNRADLLISDTSSIRFDFAFIYEKPVITLDIKGEEMPGFERDFLAEIWTDGSSSEIGMVVKREEIDRVTDYIAQALQQYDSERIREFRAKTVANFGRASVAMVERLSAIVGTDEATCSTK